MATRCSNLWRKLGSKDRFPLSVFSAAICDFGAVSHHLRAVYTEAASQTSSEGFSSQENRSRGGRKAGASNRFTRRNERKGPGTEYLSHYKSKWPFGAGDFTASSSGGNFLEINQENAAGSSRKVEKPHVHVTSDFCDYRGMQLVFLGTSSSIPTLERSTSCIALRLEGSIFLFDCGEGAVRQILKTPMKHYDVGNIFVTHMHGDHEGLLCRLGLKEFRNKEPIQLYGPKGLREWIRTTLKASHARVHPKYSVHELHLKKTSKNVAHSWNYVEDDHEDELPGRDIFRSEDGLWHVLKNEKYTVRAGFLRHSIPCWGYVVEEHTRRGRFDVERAREAGVKERALFDILETGDSVMLADGRIVYPSDVLGTPRRGRKVVILGDTCDSKSLLAAAQEADVLVHEATVLEQDASGVLQRGHSTAKMAGEFARRIKADTLVLTHFSRKLDGALFVDERSTVRETMGDIVSSAQEAFQNDNVIAAEDMMAITIQLEDKPPVKDSQHLTPVFDEDEEYKPTQRRITQLSQFSNRNTKLTQSNVPIGQMSPPRTEDQKNSVCTHHLSPAQPGDKTLFLSVKKRGSSRTRRPSSVSE